MRFKTKCEKLILGTVGLAIGIAILGTGRVEAALQANLTTHNASSGNTKTGQQWILQIRQMETSGGTMGLNESIDTTTLIPTTSNNIDVHMMRSTEYGAMAILSASSYGGGFSKSKPLSDSKVTIKSTTGNATGVYLTGLRYEWVAGVASTSTASGVDKRYVDIYSTSKYVNLKAGDALGRSTDSYPGCQGWHGNASSEWPSRDNFGFTRGKGSIFSFDGNNSAYTVWNSYSLHGRGVAVTGEGF